MNSKVKIWGCRRSGTNWTATCIRLNINDTDALQHDTFWKHAPYVRLDEVDLDLCLTKHPHAWLQSILRYYDGSEVRGEVKVRPMAENWANLNLSYLEAAERWEDVHILRYEDMLDNPEEKVRWIAEEVGGGTDEPLEINYRTRVPTNLRKESYEDVSLSKFKDFYLGDGFYDILEAEQVRTFNAHLGTIKHGPNTAERLGYDITPPKYMR